MFRAINLPGWLHRCIFPPADAIPIRKGSKAYLVLCSDHDGHSKCLMRRDGARRQTIPDVVVKSRESDDEGLTPACEILLGRLLSTSTAIVLIVKWTT